MKNVSDHPNGGKKRPPMSSRLRKVMHHSSRLLPSTTESRNKRNRKTEQKLRKQEVLPERAVTAAKPFDSEDEDSAEESEEEEEENLVASTVDSVFNYLDAFEGEEEEEEASEQSSLASEPTVENFELEPEPTHNVSSFHTSKPKDVNDDANKKGDEILDKRASKKVDMDDLNWHATMDDVTFDFTVTLEAVEEKSEVRIPMTILNDGNHPVYEDESSSESSQSDISMEIGSHEVFSAFFGRSPEEPMDMIKAPGSDQTPSDPLPVTTSAPSSLMGGWFGQSHDQEENQQDAIRVTAGQAKAAGNGNASHASEGDAKKELSEDATASCTESLLGEYPAPNAGEETADAASEPKPSDLDAQMLNLHNWLQSGAQDVTENSGIEHVLGEFGKAAPVHAMHLQTIDEVASAFENDDATNYEEIEHQLGDTKFKSPQDPKLVEDSVKQIEAIDNLLLSIDQDLLKSASAAIVINSKNSINFRERLATVLRNETLDETSSGVEERADRANPPDTRQAAIPANNTVAGYSEGAQETTRKYVASSTDAEKQKNSKLRSLAKRLRPLRTFRENDTKKPAKEKKQPKEKETRNHTNISNNIVKATAIAQAQPVKPTAVNQAATGNEASPEKQVDDSIYRPEDSTMTPAELILQDWLNRPSSPEKKEAKNFNVDGPIEQLEESTAKAAVLILNEDNTNSAAVTPTCIAKAKTDRVADVADVVPMKIISAFGSHDEDEIVKPFVAAWEFPPTAGSDADENKLNAESKYPPEVKIENLLADLELSAMEKRKHEAWTVMVKKLSAAEKRRREAWTWESPMTASTGGSNGVWYKGFVEWGCEADPINHLEEEQKQEDSDICMSLRPSHSKPQLDRQTIEQTPASSPDAEKAPISFVVNEQTPFDEEQVPEVRQKTIRHRIAINLDEDGFGSSNQREDAVKKNTETKAISAQSLPNDMTPASVKTIASQWHEPQEEAVAKSSEFEDRTKKFRCSAADKTPNRHNITNSSERSDEQYMEPKVEISQKQFTPLSFEEEDDLFLFRVDSQLNESHDENVALPKRLFQEADELVPRGPKVQNYAGSPVEDIFDFESLTKEHEIVSDKTAFAKNSEEWNNFGKDDKPKSAWNFFSGPAQQWATAITSPKSVSQFRF